MSDYHVYKMNDEGHVHYVEVIQADNDGQAIERAKQFKEGLALEVWDHARRVGAIPKSDD
jgi:hypothetical protein